VSTDPNVSTDPKSTTDTRAIVAALDGSGMATQAARWGAALASKLGAPLELLTVLPDRNFVLAEMATLGQVPVFAEAEKEAEERLEAANADLQAQHPDLAITTAITSGSAVRALIDASRNARLLVIGASGAGLVESTLVGSTTIRVSGRALCPVAVWRGESATLDDRPIVVGIDGSESSEIAAATAFELASRAGATVVGVRSYSSRRPIAEVTIPNMVDWNAVEKSENEALETNLAPFVEKYPDVNVTEIVAQVSPARLLLESAHNAQLIVVGSRGRGHIVGGLFGSTSQNLLHRAPCPIVICRDLAD